MHETPQDLDVVVKDFLSVFGEFPFLEIDDLAEIVHLFLFLLAQKQGWVDGGDDVEFFVEVFEPAELFNPFMPFPLSRIEFEKNYHCACAVVQNNAESLVILIAEYFLL